MANDVELDLPSITLAKLNQGKAKFLTEDWEGAVTDMKGTTEKLPQDTTFRNQLYDCLNLTSLMLISYSLEGDDKRSKYDNCEDIEEGMSMGVVVVIRFISKVDFLAVDGTVDNIGFVYRMALLLGPPSSGKTTLLLALAEKLIKYELPSMNQSKFFVMVLAGMVLCSNVMVLAATMAMVNSGPYSNGAQVS
ncbi:DnaJ protein P58IPK [Tanacetum coccineum]